MLLDVEFKRPFLLERIVPAVARLLERRTLDRSRFIDDDMPAWHRDGIGEVNRRSDEQIQQRGLQFVMTDLDLQTVRRGASWDSRPDQGKRTNE